MDQRSGNIYPSALSARKFAQRSVYELFKIKKFCKFRNSFRAVFAFYSVKRGAVLQIFPDGQFFIENGVLKNDTDLSAYLFHSFVRVFSAHGDGTRVF